MLQSKSRTYVEVDLKKIEHNTRVVQKLLGNTKIMGVVKANAYGHGDVEIAKKLQSMGIDFFAVSSVDEAIRLRENGIDQRILILGYTPRMHLHYLSEYAITQCVMSLEYAHILDTYARAHDTIIKGHVKLDTGMSRLGIQVKEDNYLIDDVKKCYQLEGLQIDGIFSHFSVSDSFTNKHDLDYTDMQIRQFNHVLDDLKASGINPGLTHIQNSYGCLNYNELPYDYARPGIILLGNVSDDHDVLKQEVDLQPSLEWKANVSLVKTIKKGCDVSYGRHFRASEDMKVATISAGYADGVNRNASNHGLEILVHGKRCKVLGNICMDQFVADVSEVSDVKEGDEVTLVGKEGNEIIKIDELSRAANTINNESFTLISARVPRFYKD